MNPWPGPASVLLMDNCAIHKSQVLQDAVAEKGESSHSLDSKLIYHRMSYSVATSILS